MILWLPLSLACALRLYSQVPNAIQMTTPLVQLPSCTTSNHRSRDWKLVVSSSCALTIVCVFTNLHLSAGYFTCATKITPASTTLYVPGNAIENGV